MTAPASTAVPVAEEQRRALRALLQSPLLCASGPSAREYGLVRRHADWLREWLSRNVGWTLHVDSEVARLRKTAAALDDGSRPARDPQSGLPFTRRRYALLCLALAVLERAERQITLGRLRERIEELWMADPTFASSGLSFSMSTHDERRDLVHAVRLLLELRVLVRVHGDEQQFVVAEGDVLYNVRRASLAGLLCVRRAPSSVDAKDIFGRIAAVSEELFPDTEDGRNRQLRFRLTRRLLEDPVVYFDELSADELAYLTRQRGFIARQLHSATGLHPEVRKEGIAFVDEGGALTDVGLPEEGTEGHLTLLLAEFLAEMARREPAREVPRASIHRKVAELIEANRTRWRKDVTEAGADVRLTEETLERLEALKLVRRTEAGVIPRPAIGRYAVEAPSISGELLEAGAPRRVRRRPRARSEQRSAELLAQESNLEDESA